jgi:hypothetical protein
VIAGRDNKTWINNQHLHAFAMQTRRQKFVLLQIVLVTNPSNRGLTKESIGPATYVPSVRRLIPQVASPRVPSIDVSFCWRQAPTNLAAFKVKLASY